MSWNISYYTRNMSKVAFFIVIVVSNCRYCMINDSSLFWHVVNISFFSSLSSLSLIHAHYSSTTPKAMKKSFLNFFLCCVYFCCELRHTTLIKTSRENQFFQDIKIFRDNKAEILMERYRFECCYPQNLSHKKWTLNLRNFNYCWHFYVSKVSWISQCLMPTRRRRLSFPFLIMFSTCCHWEIFFHLFLSKIKIIKKNPLGNICQWRHIYFMQINSWHWMKFWWIQCLTNVIIFHLRVGRIIIITWCLISCCLDMNHHHHHHPHHIAHISQLWFFSKNFEFSVCLCTHTLHGWHGEELRDRENDVINK